MRRLSKLSERELDSLLAGKAPSGDGDHAELAAFVRELRASYGQEPSEATQVRHLAAIAEAARGVAASAATATLARPVLSANRARSPQSISRRRLATAIPLSSKRAKLVAAVALLLVLLAAFGGVAYAGQLPDPVQKKVSDIADNVGIQLNDGQHNNVDDGDVENADSKGGANDNQRDGGNLDQGAKGGANEGPNGDDQRNTGNLDQGAKGGANEPAKNDADQQAEDNAGSTGPTRVDDKGQNQAGNQPDEIAPTGTGESEGQGTGSDQGDGSN